MASGRILKTLPAWYCTACKLGKMKQKHPSGPETARAVSLFFCQMCLSLKRNCHFEVSKCAEKWSHFRRAFLQNVFFAVAKCKFLHNFELVFSSVVEVQVFKFEISTFWQFPSLYLCDEGRNAIATFCSTRKDLSSVASKMYESLEKISVA